MHSVSAVSTTLFSLWSDSLPWFVVTPDKPCSPPHSSCKTGDKGDEVNGRNQVSVNTKTPFQGGKV